MNKTLHSGVYALAPVASPEEFADRVRRLQDQMEEAGIDVVAVTSRDNLDYFSGFRTFTWGAARPMFLVIGRSAAVIVASQTHKQALAAVDAECEVCLYEGFHSDAAAAVVAVCQSLTAKSATVGVDYGHELIGLGSLTLIEGLASLGTVVGAGSIIWNVRAIKSDFELDLLRATFDIANRSFDAVLDHVRVGSTEVDLLKALQIELIRLGADRVDPFPVLFGKTGFLYWGRPASNRRLEVGDYIWTDFASSYGGYPADRNRTARVGQPSSAECDAYTAVRQVTIDLCKGIRAGSTCADAYQLFLDLWKAAGLKEEVYGSAGRIGHGGGMGGTEPPSIAADSKELIKPGMVLHVEPKLEMNPGVFQFEEIVHIGEDQNEFLSALSPAELPIIEA